MKRAPRWRRPQEAAQQLVALPPAVLQRAGRPLVGPQQLAQVRPVLVLLAPARRAWARVRSVLAPQQALAQLVLACSALVLAVARWPAQAQQRPTPRWPLTALAQRRAWVAACWAPAVQRLAR